MIRCPKCGAENQLGAIFCRSCGEKLELDELRPDDIASADSKGLKAVGTVLRNLISLAVLIAVIAGLCMIFMKPKNVVFLPELEGEAKSLALKRFKKFRKGKSGTEHPFTVAEVNMLARMILGLTEEDRLKAAAEGFTAGDEAILVPEDLAIELLGGGNVRIVLRSRLKDKLDVYTVIIGKPTATDGGMGMDISKIYAGRFEMNWLEFIPATQDAVIERFVALIQNNQPFEEQVRKPTRGVTIEFDKAILRK